MALFGLGAAVLLRPRVLIAVGAVAAAAAGAWYLYDSGRESEREAQRERTEEARKDAFRGASDWRGCLDAGGVWDFERSRCREPD